ncbi:MAG: peptide deformylase [bacterium]|nr:peptide deformylase [bacterium]
MEFPSKVIIYGNPVLKKRAKEVEEITRDMRNLIPHMIRVMRECKGVGLAAPQIDISQRVIIVQGPKKPLGFFNPRILKKSKTTQVGEEGCLSIPGLFINVKRAKEVEVECQDSKGEKVRMKASGLIARIFQHEIDHLEGKLIIDHVPFWKRSSVLKEWREARLNHS